jgi:nitrite reductase (NADH) large subunit
MIKPLRKKLVVIGNGMAGARVVEEILKRAPNAFDISMFGRRRTAIITASS